MVDIIGAIKEGKKKYIKSYPVHCARASEIGHPCERYLVHSIRDWNQKKPHDPEVQFIFEGGNAIEDLAVKDFEDAGFKVYRPEPDKAIMESKPKITGHIDIRVDFGDGHVYTGEIKGLNIFDWQALNSIDDFYKSRKPWIKKYPAQLMTYLYIKGEERGFFYLKSIPRFQPKLIWVDLDLGYMESILQKTERVEKHVANGTYPDRVDDLSICEHCPFAHICLPDMNREEMEFLEDSYMVELLDRRDQLQDAKKEYDEADTLLKKAYAEREKLTVGDWLVIGKWIERKGYIVQDSRYMTYKITKV